MFRKILLSILVLQLLGGAVLAQEETELPDLIEVERPGFIPEGIEWDAERERFLLGSLIEGTIFEVTDDGTITPFIEDEELLSSVGIEVDEANDRLLVANSEAAVFSDESVQGNISLAAYDLETGERVYLAPLSELYPDGRHFANDVAVDDEGNAYVTDSFSPVIYKVDPEGNASIFLEDERFSNQFFGLNGIVYHAHGYLIAAMAGTGELFKIPLDDPSAASVVEMDEGVSADGMVLNPDGILVAVVGNNIYYVTSEDEWATAEVTEKVRTLDSATTVAVRDEEIYMLYAHLDMMGNPAQEIYEIVRVGSEE